MKSHEGILFSDRDLGGIFFRPGFRGAHSLVLFSITSNGLSQGGVIRDLVGGYTLLGCDLGGILFSTVADAISTHTHPTT